MNEIQIFNHEEFGEIRTIEIDGQVYFVGVDVAKALQYKDPSRAIRQNVDNDDRQVINTRAFNPGILNTIPFRYGIRKAGNPNVTIINESGLYSLILASKLPSAKKSV